MKGSSGSGAEDAEPKTASRNGVQAIDRAVAILKCFDARRPTLGITEIARMTGLSTSTTHRLLVAMQENRLVRQTSERRYGPGTLLLQLARSGAVATTWQEVALPLMTELRDEINETVAIHELLSTGERTVVAQVESRHELRRTYTDLGVPLPLPLGAPGRAILSMLPVERQEWWLAQPMRAVTPATATDPAQLRAMLAEARARGWADSFADRTQGIIGVAAPVFDHLGDVVGSIGVSAPEVRMGKERRELIAEKLRAIAWTISESLGATEKAVEHTVTLAMTAEERAGTS